MPEFDDLDAALDAAIKRAAKRTDDKLADQASSVTRLTNEDIKQLFPKPADVQKLRNLMKIVKGAESRNKRVNKLVKDIDSLAGTVITLLERFA